MVNALIIEQGPNYAPAAVGVVVARADGILTSVHVAPPSRTQSVHKNPIMEKGQRLTARLGIETFDAATSQAIAAAILVHALRNPNAPANPKCQSATLTRSSCSRPILEAVGGCRSNP